MHLNQDISEALQLLEHIKSDISKMGDPRLERDTLCDLQLLISALDNPAVRGQAILQDSVHDLCQQLLKDPQLSADSFDITFAGRLLLDDGHYSEPVYESPDDDAKNENIVGRRAPEEERRRDGQRQHQRASTGVQTTPTPVLSIPVPTTPLLVPASRSPAILLQIPLLTEKAATAGLTINDLYLGRLTPEVGAVDDGMAMFRASSGDSDRSPNGSQTSLNSGWSKSSSIVQLNCEEDGRRSRAGGDVPKINQGSAQCNPPTKQPQRVETTPTIGEHNQPSTPVIPPTQPARHHQSHHAHRLHDHAYLPSADQSDDDDDGPAGWADIVTTVELTKGTRGLGFSVCERGRGACVVGSLVEGGVAKVDGRLRPGDRLFSVNGRPLMGGGLDEAVLALRGASCGPVSIGVRRRLDRHDDDHYEEIEGGRETQCEREVGKMPHREGIDEVMTQAKKVQVHSDEDTNKEQYEARAELHLKQVQTRQVERAEQAECD